MAVIPRIDPTPFALSLSKGERSGIDAPGQGHEWQSTPDLLDENAWRTRMPDGPARGVAAPPAVTQTRTRTSRSERHAVPAMR